MENLSLADIMSHYVGFINEKEEVFLLQLNKNIRIIFKKYQRIFIQKRMRRKTKKHTNTLYGLDTSFPMFNRFEFDKDKQFLLPLLKTLQDAQPSSYGSEPKDITIKIFGDHFPAINIPENNLNLTNVEIETVYGDDEI